MYVNHISIWISCISVCMWLMAIVLGQPRPIHIPLSTILISESSFLVPQASQSLFTPSESADLLCFVLFCICPKATLCYEVS